MSHPPFCGYHQASGIELVGGAEIFNVELSAGGDPEILSDPAEISE
jgi:hypothetical protein